MEKTIFGPLFHLLHTVLLLTLFSNSLHAEDRFYDQPGFNPRREYSNQAPKEHIDPFTGNLLLTYTDIYLPGNGGLDLKIQRTYNSKIYRDVTSGDFNPIPGSWVGVGWTLHMGRIVNANPQNVATLRNTYVEMPDGSRHYLSTMTDNSGRFITNDFWIVEFIFPNIWKMTLKDGTVYRFENLVFDEELAGINYATSIRDTNGNEITISYYECSSFTSTKNIREITDSVGRSITFEITGELCGRNDQRLDYIDVNGERYSYDYDSFGFNGLTYYLLTRMTPPVGPSWEYTYNTTAFPENELTSVTYPSEGNIDYTFGTVNFPIGGLTIRFRAVTSRRVSGSGISTGTWNYAYNMGGSSGDNTTITDPCGNREIYTFAGLGWSALNGKWQVGLTIQKRVFQGSTLMQTENYTWAKRLISFDQFDTDFDTFTPLLASKVVSRGGVNYTTNYNSYDNYGNPTSIGETGQLSRTTDIDYFYNTADYIVDKPTLYRVSNGSETRDITYTYDTFTGNLTSINRYGVVTDFDYFTNGNVQWEQNARGIYTRYSYTNGVVSSTGFGAASPSGTPVYSVTRTINWEGTVASETNGRGFKTTFTYDDLNRLTGITPPEPDEAATVISYDNSDGRWKKVTKDVYFTQSNFDGLGRFTGTNDSGGILTDVDYNSCGQKTYESYPYTSSNIGDSYTYDAIGRVKKVTHPDSTFISYSYSDNNVTITNERDINTTYDYESFGDPDEKRLARVSDPAGTTNYDYNLLGSLTLVDPPSGDNRTFQYNSKNFLDSETHPENGTTDYTLNSIGNVIQRNDEKGNTTTYIYDNLNRLTNIGYPGTSYDVSFSYDKADNRIGMSSPQAAYNYTYDKSNRLTEKNATISGVSCDAGFAYDKRNNISNILYTTGRSVFYGYDPANRISGITGFANSFSYHPSGAPLSYTYANSVSNTFTYGTSYRLINLKATKGTTNLVNLTHAYDEAGNVTRITNNLNPSRNQTFGYDSLDRLTSADGSWGNGSFRYNAIGGRTSKSIGGSATTYSYSSSTNRLSSSSGAEPASYVYDPNGNTTNDGAFIYDYDPENRLIKVRSGSTTVAEYFYDGDGLRVRKKSGSSTTVYCRGQGSEVLSEHNGAGQPLAVYIYAGTRHIAIIENGVGSFYHSDNLGSPIAITDSAGTVTWRQHYLPFGVLQSTTGNSDNSHLYTGKEYELETGLYYYGARYYDPATGRFITVDPADGDPENPQSWNRYAYTLNNPYKFIDPDGKAAINVQGIIGLNNQARTTLSFLPTFVLDTLFPIDREGIANSLLEIGPQTLGTGVVSKIAGKASRFLNRTAVKGERVFERVVSNAELEATLESGLLRGGREGKNFFTNRASINAKRAQQRLSLNGPLRDFRIRFSIKDDVEVIGPQSVLTGESGTPGRGLEFFTEGRTPIQILKVDRLRK